MKERNSGSKHYYDKNIGTKRKKRWMKEKQIWYSDERKLEKKKKKQCRVH
jgi:hypothetical protein